MKNFLVFLIFLSNFAFCIERENSFSLGIEYNSLLYEFEEKGEHSFYYNFEFKGSFSKKKTFLFYNFSLLYPFSYSEIERKPLKIGTGNINLNNYFHLFGKSFYEFSIFYNFKKAEDAPERVPVEEETYNFYGIDNSMDLFSDFKLKFGLNFLKPENYEIFKNKKYYSGFKYSKNIKESLKIFSDLNFSKYYFDKKILTIPEEPGEIPIPELKEHRENLYSIDLGFEYFSNYILNIMVFFQKKDATVEDFSNKSFGMEGLFSMDLKAGLNMSLAFRYEKRYLKKKFLFFEPNILTGIGTSYIYLNFKKKLKEKNEISLKIGRFVHDAREDFFQTPSARYKASISFSHLF
ncbi:MAG: hypothetical protein ABIM62_07610 [candidate division WOR-3 bacterium]